MELFGSNTGKNIAFFGKMAAKMRGGGFQVTDMTRSAITGKEKQVDVRLAQSMCEAVTVMKTYRLLNETGYFNLPRPARTLCLVSGDRDYFDVVQDALEEGIEVEVWAFAGSIAQEYRSIQARQTYGSLFKIRELDDYVMQIGFIQDKFRFDKCPEKAIDRHQALAFKYDTNGPDAERLAASIKNWALSTHQPYYWSESRKEPTCFSIIFLDLAAEVNPERITKLLTNAQSVLGREGFDPLNVYDWPTFVQKFTTNGTKSHLAKAYNSFGLLQRDSGSDEGDSGDDGENGEDESSGAADLGENGDEGSSTCTPSLAPEVTPRATNCALTPSSTAVPHLDIGSSTVGSTDFRGRHSSYTDAANSSATVEGRQPRFDVNPVRGAIAINTGAERARHVGNSNVSADEGDSRVSVGRDWEGGKWEIAQPRGKKADAEKIQTPWSETWGTGKLRCHNREFCYNRHCTYHHTDEERRLRVEYNSDTPDTPFVRKKYVMCKRKPGECQRKNCHFLHEGEWPMCVGCLGTPCRKRYSEDWETWCKPFRLMGMEPNVQLQPLQRPPCDGIGPDGRERGVLRPGSETCEKLVYSGYIQVKSGSGAVMQ